MVFGTFDIIHPGHVHLLNEAKEYGDYLIAVIARDKTVHAVKKHAPKFDEKNRLENLSALNIANKVILGEEGEDKYASIRQEKPDVIALGYDQKHFIEELEDALEDHVLIVRLSPYRQDIYKSSKLTAE